jgi:hypothetical protein
MLKLEVDGEQVEFWFSHKIGTIEKPDGVLEDRRFTLCEGKVDGDLYAGVAICNPTDQYCKKTGRKLALADFLNGAFPTSRTARKQVWDAYLAKARV